MRQYRTVNARRAGPAEPGRTSAISCAKTSAHRHALGCEHGVCGPPVLMTCSRALVYATGGVRGASPHPRVGKTPPWRTSQGLYTEHALQALLPHGM